MKVLLTLLANALMLVSLTGCREQVAFGEEVSDDVRAADNFLLSAADHPQEWRTHGGTYAEQRYSTLHQIDESNVSNLGLAWTFDTGTTRGLEATPIVVDGMFYATVTWSKVFALDARTGTKKWEWDPEVDRAYGRRACCDVVNRGVAYHDGRIFVGVLDSRLVALDAKTGELLWEVVTADQSQPYTITGAPRVINGKVLIGNGGAEFGVRGYVSAYDTATGALAWRFYTVPGNPADGFESAAMEKAAATWRGEWWTMGGGGTVWDSMAYDPELDLVYIGTGNGSPWNREVRSPGGGDNLYLSSIIALDAQTGEYAWHYQTTPGDSWDYTATQHIILADLEIAGEERNVLMQAPKNGFFFVLDRATGELISAEKYVPITWATYVDPTTGRPVEVPGARYEEEPFLLRPSALGGHNWQPMSFSPDAGLVYIPAQLNNMNPGPPTSFEFVKDRWNLGIGGGPVPADVQAALKEEGLPSGHLLAWDPVAQKEAWRVEHAVMWNGGMLTTAGNLLFQGTGERSLVAYRATDGHKLWEVPTSTSIIAPPISYELDGSQYISVLAGWGGAFGLARADAVGTGKRGGWILTFALAGSAAMPESSTRAQRPPPAIEFEADDNQISSGSELYDQYCSVCHGGAAQGGGVLPDLRYSAPRVFDGYQEILLEGRLIESGMPSFAQFFSEEGVTAIQSFILSERARLVDGL
jgi:PQQ-dependent dehydrogenase (methanol/ethanol family)